MPRHTEIVRQGFADLKSGRTDTWMQLWEEDGVLHELPEIPDRDAYFGREGLREWLNNLRGVLGDFSFEPLSLEERGDYVLAETEARGTGAGAGVPVDWKSWIVFRFRGDKVAEAWGFLDEAQAREQAGMVSSGEDAVG